MRKSCVALLISASLLVTGIAATPAYAGGGDVAAGLFGGLAVGTLLGVAVSEPRYLPPPVYVAPVPAAGPSCYWTHGEPYWDPYRGAWIYPRVWACE